MREVSNALAARITEQTGVFPASAGTARDRAANAIRQLIDTVVDPTFECSDAMAAQLEQLARSLDTSRTASRFGRPRGQHCTPTFPMGTHPVMGEANPIAPVMRVDMDGDTVVGHAVYGAAYEGIPGSVYGGFIAAAFDAVLGIRAALEGTPCSAVSLGTQFLELTPTHVPVTYRVWLSRVDGRKVYVRGELTTATGTVTATGEAVFLAIALEQVTTDR